MDGLEFIPVARPDPPPRTLKVLAIIAMAAGVFSYLWAYCLTDALVAADMIAPISRDADPRPRWLVTTWFILMVVFIVVGYLLQRVSARQLSSIDEMEKVEDTEPGADRL
jgi:hypothetical protein